jgi:4-hydroxythreonine-4-phosphate dehydrogenase
VHLALAEVPRALTVEGITRTARLAAESLQRDFGVKPVRMGVLGLNPHAGENGIFGREESDIIGPAIDACRRELGSDVVVSGPLIPDAAFRQAADGDYDVLVAMYHDQGLIPVKLVDFEKAVNVTLGLPIVRTSPDHGVAYDIAGTGKARPDSFIAALKLAVELVERRSASQASEDSSAPGQPG